MKFMLQMKFILVLMKVKLSIRTIITESLFPKAKSIRNIGVSELFDLTRIQKLWITDPVQVKLDSLKHTDFSQGKSIDPSLIHFEDLGYRQVAL